MAANELHEFQSKLKSNAKVQRHAHYVIDSCPRDGVAKGERGRRNGSLRRGTNALFVLPLTKCLCAPCVFTIAKLLIGFLFNICFRWILFLVFLSFHLRLFSRRDFVFIDACVDIIDDLIEQTKGDAAEREREVERERGIR